MIQNKLFIDVETTGTQEEWSIVHQLSGYCIIDDKIEYEFDYKIKPYKDFKISVFSKELGVNVRKLNTYQNSKEVIYDLIKKLKGRKWMVYAWNATFDFNHVFHFFKEHNEHFLDYVYSAPLCVRTLAIKHYENDLDKFPRLNLELFAKAHDIEIKAHDGFSDISATVELFYLLKL